MYLQLNGEITAKTTKKVLNALNEIEGNLTFLLDTEGGLTTEAEKIIYMINENKERITLIAAGDIISAGFEIFFLSKCKRDILPNTTGMYHSTSMELRTNHNKKVSGEGNLFSLEHLAKKKTHTLEVCKIANLTAQETQDVAEGKDVYFHYDRLLEMFAQVSN